MHIQYSYTQGVLARVATSAYFATRGRDKVGFTRIQDGDDPPHLVRGIRGALERNTMRYYLAFDAYLHALAKSGAAALRSRASSAGSPTRSVSRASCARSSTTTTSR